MEQATEYRCVLSLCSLQGALWQGSVDHQQGV